VSSEIALRAALRRALGYAARLVRVENGAAGPGTPDVYYRLLTGEAGWLELKEHPEWPARESTPLRLPSLSLEQVMWLEAEAAANGRAHVLLQVAERRLLLDPATVRGVYARELTRAALLDRAVDVGVRRLNGVRLLRALRGSTAPDLPY